MAIFTHPTEARRLFNDFAAGEIDNSNLAYGALLIALEEYPDLDPDDYLQQLAGYAERVRARGAKEDPPVFSLAHIQAELFDEEHFTGNELNYYDPKNSYLNEVIDRKTGIPITLSIVFIDIATRVGLDVAGVGLPGHFIVKAKFDISEVYVDPFHDGATLSIKEIDGFLQSRSGGQVHLQPEHLRAWTGRETLIRVLLNLQNIYNRIGDTKRIGSARERIQILLHPQVN